MIKSIILSKRYPILIFLCLSFLLVTCMKAEPQKEVLNSQQMPLIIWWNRGYYTAQDEAFEQVVSQWKQQTNRAVEVYFYSQEDTIQELIKSLEIGSPPDLVFSEQADSTLIPRLAWDGQLTDLSAVINPFKKYYEPQALASAELYNQVNHQKAYYAVPLMLQTIHIHYWRDLLQEINLDEADIPQDWNGFWNFWKTAQEKLKEKGNPEIYGLGLPMSIASSDTYMIFEQILKAYEVNLLDKNAQLLINEPAMRNNLVKIISWYTQFYKDGYVPPDAAYWSNADNNTQFLDRRVLMTINPTLSIPASQREDTEIYLNQLRTIPFPKNPNGKPIQPLVSFKQVISFPLSKNKQVAQNFLSFLIQPEHLGAYVKGVAGRYFPIMPQLWNDPFWHNPSDPHISSAIQQLKTAENQTLYHTIHPAYAQVNKENIWGYALSRVIQEGISPEQATDEAIKRINEIFEEWQS